MNRRQIFNSLSVFMLSILALPKMGFAKIQRSTKAGALLSDSESETGEYTTIREFKSLVHPNKTYRTISEFWNDHQDRVSDALKKDYLRRGDLTSSSTLLEDGQTIRQVKTFKSKRLFSKYQKSMRAFYSSSEKPFKENLKRVS